MGAMLECCSSVLLNNEIICKTDVLMRKSNRKGGILKREVPTKISSENGTQKRERKGVGIEGLYHEDRKTVRKKDYISQQKKQWERKDKCGNPPGGLYHNINLS